MGIDVRSCKVNCIGDRYARPAGFNRSGLGASEKDDEVLEGVPGIERMTTSCYWPDKTSVWRQSPAWLYRKRSCLG